MLIASRPLTVTRHDAPEAWWEVVASDLDPRLRPYIVSWCGFREWTASPSRRREVPGTTIPFIIDFRSAYRVAQAHAEAQAPARWTTYRHGFAAGMCDSFALTESTGFAEAMQVNFTPIGAHLFLGRPMSDLSNRLATVEDLFGAVGVRLVDALQDAPEWDRRFDLLEAFLLRRLSAARDAAPSVLWAWQELTRTAGQVAIGGLAKTLGCSRKHLIAKFHEQIGAPPKTVARILRFERAVRLLRTGGDLTGADVALECGYFDQAHCIREFKQFAGVTPGDFARHALPDLDAVGTGYASAAP